ncbi:toll/interleukin-1 receptor domain-containing protein [Arthrobacter sp. KNU40]|uniref:toll/interleukin-1 receptor domain-containing protein n=1 Tax=Arthrobacter sp. KNU40 TaxID=3447965 RepID=UPI003F60FD64
MKVFISWSGPESKAVALLLKPWLKMILQATEPWMSDLDIDPGSRWSQDIASELKKSDIGIICVTPENQNAAWIQFEAGALSIALNDIDRKVIPLLIGFNDRNELQSSPLDVFNNVLFNDEGMRKLVSSINSQLPNKLDDSGLRTLFDSFWPQLKAKVDKLREEGALTAAKPLTQPQMVAEILDTVRDIQRQSRSRSTSGLRVGTFGRTVEDSIRAMRSPQDDHMRNELTSHLLRDVSRLLHEFGIDGTVVLDVGHLKVITTTPLTGEQTNDVQETALNYLSIVNATSIEVDPYAVDTSLKDSEPPVDSLHG